MSDLEYHFDIGINIDSYLAMVSKLYKAEGNVGMQQLIVNSKVKIDEGATYDNWNGGTYGHAIYLTVPEAIFLNLASNKAKVQDDIKRKLDSVYHQQNEFIGSVVLEMEVSEVGDWRKESGLLLSRERIIMPETAKRIWGDTGYKVFISHKSDFKREAGELKDQTKVFGVSCFVAHKDIHPTQAWLDEIENALSSMDCFLALLTDDFHNSDWTDQEIGYAVARSVPILPIKLDKLNPYGFIGKYQALVIGAKETRPLSKIVIEHLLGNEKTRDKMVTAYFRALGETTSFDESMMWKTVIASVIKPSEEQIKMLVNEYNNNRFAYECYTLNGVSGAKDIAAWINDWVGDYKIKLVGRKIVES